MKSKRHNTIVWSAALAGILFGWIAPDAHGHGNNPRDISISGPIDGYPQPQSNPFGGPQYTILSDDLGPEQAALFDAVVIDDPVPFIGGPSDVILGSVLLTAPLSLTAGEIDSARDATDITLPGDFVGQENFLDSITGPGSIGVPSGFNRIPAPGTLALMGLAALAARRRRRR
jgi:hypothetical protein